jgi:hypothetical protein
LDFPRLLRAASTFCGPLSDVNHLFEEAAETIETLKRQRLDTDMVENAARAIRNRAEQPIDMAEARYLARAALVAENALLKRAFLAGHAEGWTGNQQRRDVQHVDAEKSWNLYVENGALNKSRTALRGDREQGEG